VGGYVPAHILNRARYPATGRVRVWTSLVRRLVRDTGSVANWLPEKDAARWAAFPLDAAPRPIVLLDYRVRVEGGFIDSYSKNAWMDGAIESHPPLPPALSALLPTHKRNRRESVLAITDVSPTAAGFRCDRGDRELPAYRLKVTGMYGSCVILSPDVECWWSDLCADKPRDRGGDATIEDDGLTIHFPAFGGALTEFHRAEFQEHANYAVGRAITSQRRVPAGTAVRAVGVHRMLTGRLSSPLGARVLLDMSGQPMSVTSSDGAS